MVLGVARSRPMLKPSTPEQKTRASTARAEQGRRLGVSGSIGGKATEQKAIGQSADQLELMGIGVDLLSHETARAQQIQNVAACLDAPHGKPCNLSIRQKPEQFRAELTVRH